MTDANEIRVLSNKIERILDLALGLRDPHLAMDVRRSLLALAERVKSLGSDDNPWITSSLEMELYALVESRPILRPYGRLLRAEELLEICKDGLDYWEKQTLNRPLTTDEDVQRQVVQVEHDKAMVEVNRLIDELRHAAP